VKARLNVHRPQLGLRIPFESGPSRGVAVRGVSRYIFTIPRCSQSISFLQCLNLYFSISKATTRSVRGTAAPSARLSTPSTSTTTSGPSSQSSEFRVITSKTTANRLSSPPTRDRLAPRGRCCAAESRRPPSARRLRPPRRPAHPLTRPKRTPLMATNAAIPNSVHQDAASTRFGHSGGVG
jgi:hypothetical protein